MRSSRPSRTSAGSGRSQSYSTGRSARPSCSRSPRRSSGSRRRVGSGRAPRSAVCKEGSGLAEFHFLRPFWLLLAPVGAWLIWQLLRGRADGGGWRAVVEANLRPYVLAEPEVLRDSRLALLAALAAWVLAVVALAGPAWERLPVPA